MSGKAPQKTVQQQLKEDVLDGLKDMVIKLAWESWRQLPPQAKVWIDPDDLIVECYQFVLYDALDKYDGRTAPTTFVWHTVKNFLIVRALRVLAQKRLAEEIPIDDAIWLSRADDLYDSIEGVDALLYVFSMASPELKSYMLSWFSPAFTPPARSNEFHKVASEFRWLSERAKLGYGDCLYLMHSGFSLAKEKGARR